MAKLIVNPTSSSRREIVLPKTLLSIGRDPSNDLVLPDAMVSRRHAVIEFRGNQFYLRDCNSSNGSLVNGDRVSERSLRDGDLVAIGTARLLFRDDVDVVDSGAKVVPHPSSPRMNCPSCGSDYRKGDLFCRQCGTQLAPNVPPRVVCTACGTSVPLPARFCNACGTPLSKDPHAAEGVLEVTRPRPAEEPEAPAALAELAAGASAHGEAAREEEGEVASPPEPQIVPSEPPPAPVERPNRSSSAVEPALPAPSPAPEPRLPVAPSLPLPHVAPPTPEAPPRAPAAAAPAAAAPASPVVAGPAPAAPERPVRVPPPPPSLLRHERGADRPGKTAAPAGFGRRLAAGLIDSALVTLGQALLLTPVALYWWSRELPRAPQDVPFAPILLSLLLALLVTVLAGAYYVYFWGVRGATPGKHLLELSVEADDGSSPIGVPRAVGRLLGYLLSATILGIGFLMIAATGKGLHDRIAGTRVVRRERP